MQLQETILCAASPSSGISTGSLAFHDIRTGSILASFKQTSSKIHCTDVIETSNGQGGFVLTVQPEKSIMNVYNYQKDQMALKIVLPERLSCIAVDSKGIYCAGGTVHGRIYFWEIASGILFSSWDAHYRQVNVLRFTRDGAALVSGSDDSSVNVWSVSRLLDEDAQNDLVTPFCMLSDHTLPVTDIVCGVGLFPTCRILTSSMDHSVKVWDPSSASLLSTFQFPKAISCLAWDSAERTFFAASSDGSIHQVDLFSQREDKTGGRTVEAVGGGGVNDVIRIDGQDSNPTKKRLIFVGQPITVMCISLTGTNLLVGTETGIINTYDILSHQLLKAVSSHKGMAITYLKTMVKPVDLVGHVSLSLNIGSTLEAKDVMSIRPVVPFQRMRDSKTRDAHEVTIMLPVPEVNASTERHIEDDIFNDYSLFTQPETSEPSGSSLQSRVTELESEIARLRDQLGKAKGVNDVMWETVVQRLVSQGSKEPKETGNVDFDEESTRRRKKNRA